MNTRIALLLSLLGLGCVEGVPPAGPESLTASVTGTLERVDPADPASLAWQGVEVVEVTDDVGTCVITRTIVATESGAACDGCSLVLEEVLVEIRGTIAGCEVDLAATPTLGAVVGFQPDGARSGEGEILVGDGAAWEAYSSGVLAGDALTWHHTVRVERSGDPSFDADDLRDLREPPIVR